MARDGAAGILARCGPAGGKGGRYAVDDEKPDAVTPRPAATVMVVRDGAAPGSPLQVLMLRRTLSADFVGGAHVFPGGAVDTADGEQRAQRLCRGRTDAAASTTLGIASGGLAYWVAAIRECFEEAGLLFACTEDGAPLDYSDDAVIERFAHHRLALNKRERSFVDVCESEGLFLPVGSLHYFAHWITPEGSPRRYDTRFFVTGAPPGQTPGHDAGETIADLWVRPADALARHRAGEMDLILPTIRNLQAIGRFATTAELLEAASTAGDVPTVLPRVVADGGGVRLLLPGDPGYDDPVAVPVEGGTSRLEVDFDAAARLASEAANTPDGAEGAGVGDRGIRQAGDRG